MAKADLSNVSGTTEGSITVTGTLQANRIDAFNTGGPMLILKDTDSSGTSATMWLEAHDSLGNQKWYVGDINTNGDLRIRNQQASSSLILGTAAGDRVIIDPSGNLNPDATNTYDLGTSSKQWRNGYFDGTVNCDGLQCDGQIVAQNTAEYQLVVKDTDNTGTAAETGIAFRASDDTTQAHIGPVASGNSIFYIFNDTNEEIRFGTNGTGRCKVNADGHFIPNADDTYDLGTSSLEWRNGYFDGTVNCDGLDVDGNVNINNGHDTTLTIEGTGNAGLVLRADTDNTDETDIPKITFSQDGSINYFNIGVEGTAGTTFTGSRANTPYIEGTSSQTNGLDFATNSTRRVTLNNNGHWVPAANNTYDLGETGNRWRNVYTNDLNLSNEGGTNDVDGTWGSWTIQEGEDDLFLLNRRNGKKYKFNLSEVN